MAVTNRNSTQVANAVATPAVRNNSIAADAVKRSALGYVANAADDDATSIHRIARVPWDACVRGIKLTTGDASTAGAINVGVYYPVGHPNSAAGAVVDADLFASAFALTNGPYQRAEITDQTQYSLTERLQPLWQAAGLTSNPGGYADIAATISTTYNGAAVGQLYEVDYVV